MKVLTRLTDDVTAAEPRARLNLLLTDGEQIVGTAWYHALSVLPGDDFVAVSSEPWDDDPRWEPVPDRHLVTARLDADGPRVALHPLSDDAVTPAEGSTGP